MQYRRLGKTNLDVSVLSFGGIRLGNLNQAEVTRLIHRAVDGGMNYVDTANCYGASEELLGPALESIRDKVIISTKSLSRTLDGLKKHIALSLKRLHTDYIDIFFIHDVSTAQNWRKVQENKLIEHLEGLKSRGVIRHIAISTHDLTVGEEMMRSGKFEVVMLAYNPSNPEVADKLLPLAGELDLGVVIMKPLGGGVLSLEGSKALGFEITAAECLKYAAAHPNVSTVIPGIDKAEYVDEALEVGSGDLTQTDDEARAIENKVAIRGKNYCRGCGYCKPCPQGIEIPAALKLYNRYEAYEAVNWAETHVISKEMAAMTPNPSACIACKACEKRCPYTLPIAKLMGKAARI